MRRPDRPGFAETGDATFGFLRARANSIEGRNLGDHAQHPRRAGTRSPWRAESRQGPAVVGGASQLAAEPRGVRSATLRRPLHVRRGRSPPGPNLRRGRSIGTVPVPELVAMSGDPEAIRPTTGPSAPEEVPRRSAGIPTSGRRPGSSRVLRPPPRARRQGALLVRTQGSPRRRTRPRQSSSGGSQRMNESSYVGVPPTWVSDYFPPPY